MSELGLSMAHSIGAGLGPFHDVVTSPAPRAVETATALGFPARRREPRLASMGDRVDAELGSVVFWADYARAFRRSTAVRDFASERAELLEEIVRSVPDGGRALVVSHGGIVELGAVAAVPAHPWQDAGGPASYLEGVRLEYGPSGWTSAEVLRVPPVRPP